MNVAFCINNSGLRGLGVTLSSLISNCSNPNKLKIWFLCSNVSIRSKEKISSYLSSNGNNIVHEFRDFDPLKYFGSFVSLHGDWTNYGRILLPDIIDCEQVLYLDADLAIELDVLDIDDFKFNGSFLAAVGGGYFKYTLGRKFYIDKLKIEPNLEYFNDGVLLINIKEWRSKNIKKQCFKLGKKYSMELPSHEQSLLNIICKGDFAKLPDSFNCSWIADQPKPDISKKMIIHFIGAPKPWDPLGFVLHKGFRTWKKYVKKESNFSEGKFTLSEIKRLWNLRRSYSRCILNHLKNLTEQISLKRTYWVR